MSARTRGHLHRVAMEHGWEMILDSGGYVSYRRGGIAKESAVVHLHYGANGALVGATRYRPTKTPIDRPDKGKQTAVRQWLTAVE